MKSTYVIERNKRAPGEIDYIAGYNSGDKINSLLFVKEYDKAGHFEFASKAFVALEEIVAQNSICEHSFRAVEVRVTLHPIELKIDYIPIPRSGVGVFER